MIARYTKYILSICLFLATFPALVFGASEYVDGKDYVTLPAEVRSNTDVKKLMAKDPSKVQVVLFFGYGCPACAKFDPDFEQWVKQHQGKVAVYRMPVSFNDEWVPLAKMYFVMKALDPKESLNAKIFNAINQDDQKLWQESAMQEFFATNGYTAEQFEKAYNSASVEAQVANADQLSDDYDIAHTPTVVVNGPINSYMLRKSGNDIKTFFKVLDYLIAKESKYL